VWFHVYTRNPIVAFTMLRKDVSNLQRERRQSERAAAYWEQKARELNSRPTLAQLDPGQAIDAAEWGYRFIIAPDRLAEVSSFLMCGADLARLLEISEGPLKYSVMFRQMPKRFRELFSQGCAYAAAAGSPSRMAGAIEREDGGRELYRFGVPAGWRQSGFRLIQQHPQGTGGSSVAAAGRSVRA
jgi:hypothetical protein